MTALTWLRLESRVTPDEIKRRRDFNYRRTPERRVRTVEEARAFVEEVGFCHFWPIKGVELPNLFHAIAGRVRPVPMEHDDPDISKCWGWKDDALDKKWWYYGKFLRRKATFISLKELPYFYALSENYGSLDDYLQEYEDGLLTAEAKAIYEAILEHGPLDTIRLRREARMSAQSAKSAFERALVELQVGLKILPVGIAEAGAWRYAFIYELLPRWFPDIPERARAIGRGEAQRHILRRYLQSVVVATPAQVARLFGWSEAEVKRAAAKLEEAGEIIGDGHLQAVTSGAGS
ncbi:MAG: winged helix DNA-binding domain-containing protein [Anaerolineae bacterium]|nr:winged helix DNA-binding domain-containing protein [Anaerolineae bacterium]